jgi:hypothetical protein
MQKQKNNESRRPALVLVFISGSDASFSEDDRPIFSYFRILTFIGRRKGIEMRRRTEPERSNRFPDRAFRRRVSHFLSPLETGDTSMINYNAGADNAADDASHDTSDQTQDRRQIAVWISDEVVVVICLNVGYRSQQLIFTNWLAGKFSR